jgi:hypothetical protein
MNPFLLLLKPLFIVFTWITTGFVALIMALGGKFDGAPRTEGAPKLTAYFAEGIGDQPPTFDVTMDSGEHFRMIVDDDPSHTVNVGAETLAQLGDAPEDAVSTLVKLRSDHARTMTCRLSYHTVEREPEGVCVIGDIIYDILFINPASRRDNRPQI